MIPISCHLTIELARTIVTDIVDHVFIPTRISGPSIAKVAEITTFGTENPNLLLFIGTSHVALGD
jgi:hypothetical protein